VGELIYALCGLLAGLGLGVFVSIRWALRELRDDDIYAERMYLAGAKAQADLGFAVKRVPIDGALQEGSGNKASTQPPAPKFSTDWRPPVKGIEHPGGPVPPQPTDFTREHPSEKFVDRLKSTPG